MLKNNLLNAKKKLCVSSWFLSFLFLFYSIVCVFPLNVYADINGVDFSQAYIYDVLQGEMVQETPFVNSNREDFRMISDGLQTALYNHGVSFAGGLNDSSTLTGSQAKTMTDYAKTLKNIHDNLETPNDEMWGSVYHNNRVPPYSNIQTPTFHH